MVARFIVFIVKIVFLITFFTSLFFLLTKPWGWYVFSVIMVALIVWCLRIAFDSKLTKQQKWNKLFGNTY